MATKEEVIKALRCAANGKYGLYHCHIKDCPYNPIYEIPESCKEEKDIERNGKCYRINENEECDSGEIMRNAADMLEGMA